ncbi:hypothetical protein J6590_020213 [Homalodisca vitripennis]|nr:hypothetical protein J6590_020213 [Homalodisca vitripennis]
MTGLFDHTAQLCSVRVDFKCLEIRVKQRLVNQSTMEQLRNTLAAQDWARVIEAKTETGFEAFNAAVVTKLSSEAQRMGCKKLAIVARKSLDLLEVRKMLEIAQITKPYA